MEFSWPIGMQLVKAMAKGLWWVRSSLPGGQIARVLFCVDEDSMNLLQGFTMKTRQTPAKELDLALKRMKGTKV